MAGGLKQQRKSHGSGVWGGQPRQKQSCDLSRKGLPVHVATFGPAIKGFPGHRPAPLATAPAFRAGLLPGLNSYIPAGGCL